MKWLFVVLFGAWVLILIYQWDSSGPPKRVPLTYEKGGKKGAGLKSGEEAFKLNLDLLEKSRSVAYAKPKNIFKPVEFYKPPPPPPLPPPPVPEVKGPTPEELAAQRARQELSEFRVLGFLTKAGREEVFLSKGGELLIARQGDLIKNQFLLKELQGGRVVLKDPITNVEVTIVVEGP